MVVVRMPYSEAVRPTRLDRISHPSQVFYHGMYLQSYFTTVCNKNGAQSPGFRARCIGGIEAPGKGGSTNCVCWYNSSCRSHVDIFERLSDLGRYCPDIWGSNNELESRRSRCAGPMQAEAAHRRAEETRGASAVIVEERPQRCFGAAGSHTVAVLRVETASVD